MAGSGPVLRCPSELIRGVASNVLVHIELDEVADLNVKNTTFKVVEPKPDGKGVTDLTLQERG